MNLRDRLIEAGRSGRRVSIVLRGHAHPVRGTVVLVLADVFGILLTSGSARFPIADVLELRTLPPPPPRQGDFARSAAPLGSHEFSGPRAMGAPANIPTPDARDRSATRKHATAATTAPRLASATATRPTARTTTQPRRQP